jgi:hypothetical protein
MWAADRMRPPLFHRRLSQHPAPPTPEGSSALLSRFLAPSMAFALHERLGSLWVPVGLTSRRCRICVMLRAAVLHPFLRGIRRFSTSSHPEALGACYVASWQLPRPDLHRSANDDFSGHTMRLLGRLPYWCSQVYSTARLTTTLSNSGVMVIAAQNSLTNLRLVSTAQFAQP